MPHEIEAKYRVNSFAAVFCALRRQGARFLHELAQTDTYFDTPRGRLLKGDRGLRIRLERLIRKGAAPVDRRAQLTFKGPRKAGRLKVRQELQTRLDDPAALKAAIAACGMEPVITIRKRRAVWRLGRALVALDELPLIGRFVEVEAPTPADVQRVRRILGLPDEPIREHYVAMTFAARRGKA